MVTATAPLMHSGYISRALLASLGCLGLMLSASAAIGQSNSTVVPLSIEVRPSSYISRTSGPIPLRLKVIWSGTKVLRGDLIFELRDSPDLLGSLILRDQYFTPGEHELDLMLPPLASDTYSEFFDLAITLKQNETLTALATQQLRIPGVSSRKFVLMTSVPELELQRTETSKLADGWDLDGIQPEIYRGERKQMQRNLTLTGTISAEQLPTQALRYCVWDVLLLTGAGYAILNERQIDALTAWIRAGGSLVVILDQSALPTAHLHSLNTLLAEHEQQPQLLPQAESPPIITVSGGSEVLSTAGRFGLGRVAVVNASADSTTVSRTLAPAIWKLCHDQISAVKQDGVWSFKKAYDTSVHSAPELSYQGTDRSPNVRSHLRKFDHVSVHSGGDLVTRLLPHQFNMVPLWLMGSVLALFILAIGPIDYLFLGLLPSRKWTWITFPLMAFGFTGAAVAISNAYMNIENNRGRLIVRDVTEGGIVARETEIQLLFNNHSEVSSTQLTSSLFSPLKISQFAQQEVVWNLSPQESDGPTGQIGPPILDGFLPQSAVAIQSIPQWTPQLNRLTRIPTTPQIDATGFDWNAPVQWTHLRALKQRAQAAFGPESTIHLYRAPRAQRVHPPFEKRIAQGTPRLLSTGANEHEPRAIPEYESLSLDPDTDDFLLDISVRAQVGLFAVASQISPHGGDQFEDLSLLDPTDPDNLLLIAAVPQPDGSLIVYRRLYLKGAAE